MSCYFFKFLMILDSLWLRNQEQFKHLSRWKTPPEKIRPILRDFWKFQQQKTAVLCFRRQWIMWKILQKSRILSLERFIWSALLTDLIFWRIFHLILRRSSQPATLSLKTWFFDGLYLQYKEKMKNFFLHIFRSRKNIPRFGRVP